MTGAVALEVPQRPEALLPAVAPRACGPPRPRRRLVLRAGGRVRLGPRPERLRQDDPRPDHRRSRGRGRRRRSHRRPARGPAGPDRCLVFQHYALLPWRTVLANVELAMEIQGIPKPARRERAQRYIELVGLSRLRARTTRTSSRAGCSSAPASPGRSRPSRACSSWTSRSGPSTPRCGRSSRTSSCASARRCA